MSGEHLLLLDWYLWSCCSPARSATKGYTYWTLHRWLRFSQHLIGHSSLGFVTHRLLTAHIFHRLKSTNNQACCQNSALRASHRTNNSAFIRQSQPLLPTALRTHEPITNVSSREAIALNGGQMLPFLNHWTPLVPVVLHHFLQDFLRLHVDRVLLTFGRLQNSFEQSPIAFRRRLILFIRCWSCVWFRIGLVCGFINNCQICIRFAL